MSEHKMLLIHYLEENSEPFLMALLNIFTTEPSIAKRILVSSMFASSLNYLRQIRHRSDTEELLLQKIRKERESLVEANLPKSEMTNPKRATPYE